MSQSDALELYIFTKLYKKDSKALMFNKYGVPQDTIPIWKLL